MAVNPGKMGAMYRRGLDGRHGSFDGIQAVSIGGEAENSSQSRVAQTVSSGAGQIGRAHV